MASYQAKLIIINYYQQCNCVSVSSSASDPNSGRYTSSSLVTEPASLNQVGVDGRLRAIPIESESEIEPLQLGPPIFPVPQFPAPSPFYRQPAPASGVSIASVESLESVASIASGAPGASGASVAAVTSVASGASVASVASVASITSIATAPPSSRRSSWLFGDGWLFADGWLFGDDDSHPPTPRNGTSRFSSGSEDRLSQVASLYDLRMRHFMKTPNSSRSTVHIEIPIAQAEPQNELQIDTRAASPGASDEWDIKVLREIHAKLLATEREAFLAKRRKHKQEIRAHYRALGTPNSSGWFTPSRPSSPQVPGHSHIERVSATNITRHLNQQSPTGNALHKARPNSQLPLILRDAAGKAHAWVGGERMWFTWMARKRELEKQFRDQEQHCLQMAEQQRVMRQMAEEQLTGKPHRPSESVAGTPKATRGLARFKRCFVGSPVQLEGCPPGIPPVKPLPPTLRRELSTDSNDSMRPWSSDGPLPVESHPAETYKKRIIRKIKKKLSRILSPKKKEKKEKN
ncbi:hypothetical protein B0T24DRAFT_19099 [Lasiosphaeria ovina]|uniref:Uncharacterized protein n=1 Tax=Lasiosphaeria ovina TaxID=92902 RepID=A0AAE0NJE0_9PEZI|nr:hypothetical protein B0T24DRAFT_19099 [Lasiosphaeria ovina]